jgi:hypothetical protein
MLFWLLNNFGRNHKAAQANHGDAVYVECPVTTAPLHSTTSEDDY